MMINALNSGANVFMADFEDSLSPTWENVVQGQANLIDAVRGEIAFEGPDGRSYRLNDTIATLLVRPRGWHLSEKHVLVDGEPISASLFDFGLYVFHNALERVARGTGPYFYLPKMESHLEARLWNDVFLFAQEELEIPRGTFRATVLIETLPAAFEMEEILWELKEHASGLNAGRWDYLFSTIKTLRNRPDLALPDRAQLTMTVPFLRAYTELLVATCHRRGAHAMGGMAPFIPTKKDPKVNEAALAKVREDKQREAGDGFDGTWVAHPGLVPVAMGGVREGPRDPLEPEGPAARRRGGHGRDASRRAGARRKRHRARRPQQRRRRPSIPELLAPRSRRGGDRQPDGGRRDRRDLALPAVAVGPQRRRASRRADRDAGALPGDPGEESSTGWAVPPRAGCARRRRSWTSSSRARRSPNS